MANNSEHLSSPRAGTSGDIVILLVFFGIGTILFASFAMRFADLGKSTSTPIPALPAAGTESGITVTPTPSALTAGTGTSTSFFTTSTVTALASGSPLLTPTGGMKTNTPVKSNTPVYVYKSSTPTKVKTKSPTKTFTPFRTSTRTPTRTVTATPTATPTVTAVSSCATEYPVTSLPVNGDTWIESNAPTTNHAPDTLLSLRADNNGDRRILLKFNLSSLSGASIGNAKLYFYMNSVSGATISLHSVSRPWEGPEATWRLAQVDDLNVNITWTKEGGDYNVAPISRAAITTPDCRVQLDITTLVQDWVTNDSNEGVILIAAGTPGDISISSSRATAYPPVLLVVTNTPTVTVTSTVTLTPTITSTPRPTYTMTVTGTLTPTPTSTLTVTTTSTPTPTQTETLTPTTTPTLTETPSSTP